MSTNKTGVLLLHGLTGVPSEMRPIEKHLQKIGFETEAATLAGHGGTQEEMFAATAADWISSAESGLDRLLERCDTVVVCGLSMGASISAILAGRHKSKVSALIMLSPTLAYDLVNRTKDGFDIRICHEVVREAMHYVIWAMPWLGRLIFWTETPPYGLKDERLQRQITKAIEAAQRGEETKFGLFRTYWISLMNMNLITKKFKREASSITCPVLLVSSLEDTLVSIGNATNTYALLGSHDKYMTMLTGCDHVLTLDLKRKYVCRMIGEFMEAITGVVDTVGVSETDSQLTVEIHNRLNPLSNMDWAKLVPGSQSLTDLGLLLQRSNVHESQCHTFVVRWNNEPILMVPMVLLTRELSSQIDSGASILAKLMSIFSPNTLRPRIALLGISENAWGTAPPAATENKEQIKAAWEMLERVCRDFAGSYKCKVTAFVHSELHTITAARRHRITKSSLSQWLAERSVLTTPGTSNSSDSVGQESPGHAN